VGAAGTRGGARGRAGARPTTLLSTPRPARRARAAECFTFDVGSPSESRRLRTLTQSFQVRHGAAAAARRRPPRARRRRRRPCGRRARRGRGGRLLARTRRVAPRGAAAAGPRPAAARARRRRRRRLARSAPSHPRHTRAPPLCPRPPSPPPTQVDGLSSPLSNGGGADRAPRRSAGAQEERGAVAARAAAAAAALAAAARVGRRAGDADAAAAAAALAAADLPAGADDGGGAAAVAATSGSDAEEESREISREFKECRCCQDVLDVLSDELPHMSPHNTVTALGRLAALSKRLPPAERGAVLAAAPFVGLLQLLGRHVPDMSAFQLVNALYSAAVMGAPLSKAPALMAAADAAVARLAPSFNDRDVCSALYAYALLGHARPGSGAGSLLLSRAQALLDARALDARGISMLLWAAGSLGARHAGLTAAATRALLADGGAALAEMNSQGVANCVWGLAKATGGRVDGGLLDRALAAIVAHGDAAKPQEVLNTLWACARCRHDPAAAWSRLLAYCGARAGELAPADVASLFHALGAFGRAPEGPAGPQLLARAAELLPRMSPLEAASLYRGLGLAGQTDSAAWGELTARVIPEACAAGALDAAGKRMAFQGFLAGRLAGTEGVMPGPVLLELKGAWDAGLAARPRSGGPGRSASGGAGPPPRRNALGAEVHALLSDLGVRHDVDVTTRDGLSVVDVQLQASGGRWVALQVAGEHEFASNGGQRLGPAALQQALLEKAGYEVRWLGVHDLADKPPHKRPLYMVELLRALGVGVPRAAERAAEERAEAGPGAPAPARGRRGRGGRGGGGGGDGDGGGDGGTVVKAFEAELLFEDPKVSGGRRRRTDARTTSSSGGSGGGRRRR
jgi:hypothetical protein